MSKKIFCIRHGQALHNVLFWEMGQKVYLLYRDTPLTMKGVKQAQKLGNEWEDIDRMELIIVSPLASPNATLQDDSPSITIYSQYCIPSVP